MDNNTDTLEYWIAGFEKEIRRRFNNPCLTIKVSGINGIDAQFILRAVAEATGVQEPVLLSHWKGKRLVSDSRMAASYFLKTMLNLTEGQIGAILKRDRTSIIHHLNTVEIRKQTNDGDFLKILNDVSFVINKYLNAMR